MGELSCITEDSEEIITQQFYWFSENFKGEPVKMRGNSELRLLADLGALLSTVER